MQTVVKLSSKNKVQPITADLDGWKVVAALIYPGFELLDVFGPMEMFAGSTKIMSSTWLPNIAALSKVVIDCRRSMKDVQRRVHA